MAEAPAARHFGIGLPDVPAVPPRKGAGCAPVTTSSDGRGRSTASWAPRAGSPLEKYVFPGGLIPSVRAIEDAVRDHTAMRLVGSREFGRDHAETLRRWRERFLARGDEVASLGFDETFRRMWEFYLAYSEAGFRVGYLGVRQFTAVK
ncbi:class I SAM-dependent methyltransferase [Saccharothrix carnea]|uniref:class I SAM-dependent methyltransferase n=1 Tax=Saccharothrix carnea TaxID=1280637 RepID=UPI003CCC1CAE